MVCAEFIGEYFGICFFIFETFLCPREESHPGFGISLGVAPPTTPRSMALRVGQYVRFKDNPACSGVVFECGNTTICVAMLYARCTRSPLTHIQPFASLCRFQDDGMVAGLRSVSAKLADMGCG